MAVPSERLLARLQAMGVDVPAGSTLVRTRAGRHQRAAGAWSWFVVDARGSEVRLGSQAPVGELLAAPRLAASRPHGGTDTDVDVWAPGTVPSAWAFYAEEPA